MVDETNRWNRETRRAPSETKSRLTNEKAFEDKKSTNSTETNQQSKSIGNWWQTYQWTERWVERKQCILLALIFLPWHSPRIKVTGSHPI